MGYPYPQQTNSPRLTQTSQTPPQEKLADVLVNTNEQITNCHSIITSIMERLVGPVPQNEKIPGSPGSGVMSQAFELRSQSQRLLGILEQVAKLI